MPRLSSERRAYEIDVRGLAALAAALLEAGNSAEYVARNLVERRNALKVRYREPLDPVLLKLLEQRNQAKYGNPIGPSANSLRDRYGSWEGVIAAACRPARITPDG